MRPGESFEHRAVADYYRYRPEYPPAMYNHLASISKGGGRLLDIGCGTGKIARGLSEAFTEVTAIDASAEMLRVAQDLQSPHVNNITWLHGQAEKVELQGKPIDLIVAAASIHWMDHPVLFPRVRAHSSPQHVFAVVDGDGAHHPPWQSEWHEFLAKWIHDLTGAAYEPDNKNSLFNQHMSRHLELLNVDGETSFDHEVTQTIEEFCFCQHSRDTFAPAKLGEQLRNFDDELSALLAPHSTEGVLTYTVRTDVTWGTIKEGE